MKRCGLVKDEWGFFAPAVVPGIKAHMWSITNQGRGELEFLQSISQEHEPYPLGHRILLFMSHGALMTIGQIAKIMGKDRGHVKRVMKSLQNKGLGECLIGSTRTSFGWDATWHLYRIADLGRQVLDAGPDSYPEIIRRHKRPAVLGAHKSNLMARHQVQDE
jgi:hypothetical protein